MKLRLIHLTKIWEGFWTIIWNLADRENINLGKAAPWVFGQMIGCHGKE